MKVSVEWLQSFFDESLPGVEEIVDALTFGVAEIEGVEQKGDDAILDINILPDRAPYMLSHRGVAKEISILMNIPMKEDTLSAGAEEIAMGDSGLSVEVEDALRCPTYGALLMKGVKVGPSPDWLKRRLEAIGQRSINNIVDATNYVMFSLGTPLHAFDANKFVDEDGIGIRVRAAKDGEVITALGGDNYELSGDMTVIADIHSDEALAIAGVKGGVRAELSYNTTDIILEAAKFNPVRTRKTSQALKLRTDASNRFENEIANELPEYGLVSVAKLIKEIAGGEYVSKVVYEQKRPSPFLVGVSVEDINKRLGSKLSETDVDSILSLLNFKYEKVENPIENVLKMAEGVLGAKYKADSAFRYDAPNEFSCSSLTNYLFVQVGFAMPSISIDQYVWGTPVEEKDLQKGDLVFSNTKEGRIRYETVSWIPGTKVPEGVDHLGLYVGDGKVLHASRNPGSVVIEDLSKSSMFKNVVGYRRVVTDSEKRFVITAPFERLDLRQPADIIEEIGRVYGYKNIKDTTLPKIDSNPEVNKTYLVSERLRRALDDAGFIEVYTYSLRENGEVELANALASDKGHLRENLSGGLSEKLNMNESNAPLLGVDSVCIYEIGNVFKRDKESVHVSIAARAQSGKKQEAKSKELLDKGKAAIESLFGDGVGLISEDKDSMEWDLSAIIKGVNAADSYDSNALPDDSVMYKPFSVYPFVLRDIAAWTPEGTTSEEFENIIRDSAGDLLVRVDMFDSFSKDGRNSYAFHLVFQSKEKTLSDIEVNEVMENVLGVCNKNNFEVR